MNIAELWRKKHSPGQAFRVDSVAAATAPLPVITIGASLEQRSGYSILVMLDRNEPAVESARLGAPVEFLDEPQSEEEADSIEFMRHGKGARIEDKFVHPLIEAVHVAFAQHRPLILSPDTIWLVISQGFAHHLHENTEALRSRLVRHEGRKTLRVAAYDLKPDHWPQYIAEFSSQVRRNSDPVLYESLICDFSTTTPAVRTAGEIAVMDAYERYFRYELMCICGIPEITVTGTPEDWRRMRARVEVLATYDLEWWVSRLRPILDELVRTAEGCPNWDFWKAIYKPEQVYGDKIATGWIADLFPYLRRPDRLVRNRVLQRSRVEWTVPEDAGVTPNSFPSGLSKVPIHLTAPTGGLGSLDLLGGFFGVGQRPSDFALFPMITWAAGTPAPKPAPRFVAR
jgi:hypothetical protein